MTTTPTPRPGAKAAVRLAALVVASLVAGLAACDILGVGSDTATLEIDSSDGSAVLVITSLDFRVIVDRSGRETFDLEDADTAWVEPFYKQDYDLNETGRFYARAAEAEDTTAVVSMRVLIDGDESFAREAILTGKGSQYYFLGQ
jgi:hypothetical protein